MVCVPATMRWQAARSASWPETSTLPAQLLLAQGLDGAARGAVVAGHHRVHLVVVAGERVLHDLERLDRLPVLGPLVGDDLDVALVDQGLQDVHLALAQQAGVVVGGRAADQHVVALGPVLDDVLRLQLAHAHGVERDVEVEVGVADQPVVGDDRHARSCARTPRWWPLVLRVVRHHQQHVHALGEQVLGLRVLQRVVAVGRLHQHLGAAAPPPCFTKRSRSRCQRSSLRVSMEKPIMICSAAGVDALPPLPPPSASGSRPGARRRRAPVRVLRPFASCGTSLENVGAS